MEESVMFITGSEWSRLVLEAKTVYHVVAIRPGCDNTTPDAVLESFQEAQAYAETLAKHHRSVHVFSGENGPRGWMPGEMMQSWRGGVLIHDAAP